MAPVQIAPLVFLRIAFGAVMLWEIWRYFDQGWIKALFIFPKFHFTFFGFGWVRPWPAEGMYLHFLMLGVFALCIMVGFMYRIAAGLFFVGFAHIFLIDMALYLNHYYLIVLVSFLLIFIPANRAFSVDAKLHPEIRSDTVPAWTLWLFLGQISIVYSYGGLAKLNSDWLQGETMRIWLGRRTAFPIFGPLFSEEWVVYLFSYGGLLFDLFIVPLLLWRKTRLYAIGAAVLFHMMNAYLFRIGIFPWFMLAATLLFLPPGWLRPSNWHRARGGRGRKERTQAKHKGHEAMSWRDLEPRQRATFVLLGVYLMLQLVLPFRHFMYPGNVSWTEEGHVFSWHMKLRDKEGTARFFLTNPVAGTTREIHPERYLTSKQVRWMHIHPDMILQFSHYIAGILRSGAREGREIRAEVFTSLNGRELQLLIDPAVNLAAQPRTLRPASWIMPLEEPLRRRK